MTLDLDTLSPIVMFVYARPDHTKKTVEALQNNKYANESDLYIYSDAAKMSNKLQLVSEVRSYITTISGFRSVNICNRKYNYGLAKNIIEGVTEICDKHGRVIVLEDDIVTSQYFLEFMNKALEKYANFEQVWHVSGWNYPININGLDDVFLWRLMNCWGWATWGDRWSMFEKKPDYLIDKFNEIEIDLFNLGGAHDFWSQVTLNASGELDTWAIFWYATIFQNDGLCLNPSRSFVANIGLDGSGENCGNNSSFTVELINNSSIKCIDTNLYEDDVALHRIVKYYRWKSNKLRRGINFFSRHLIGRNLFE
jgi:hypothetical protein